MTKGTPRILGAGQNGIRGQHEIKWAHGEPHPKYGWHPAMPRRVPTRLPKSGEHVYYRANDFGPLIDAEIVCWYLDDPGDPNLNWAHSWPEGKLRITPPWPEGKLDADGHHLAKAAGPRPYEIRTREARLDGAPGWLPLDHATREYPEIGF